MDYDNETQANLFRIDYRNVFIEHVGFSHPIKVSIHYSPILASWAALANGPT